jgi:hypothetical protein
MRGAHGVRTRQDNEIIALSQCFVGLSSCGSRRADSVPVAGRVRSGMFHPEEHAEVMHERNMTEASTAKLVMNW